MIEIVVNSLKGQILNCPTSLSKRLYKFCSYRAYNYEFSSAYINGFWDGYVRKFSYKTNSFPSGLLFRIALFLKKNKIIFKIKDVRAPLIWKESQILENIEKFKFVLRPYQIEGAMKGLLNPYMIFWWATSSGKTVLFSALISALKKRKFRRTLILVTTKDLAAQHREEIGEMISEKIGVIEEGKFEPEMITVAVIDTLFNKAIKKKEKEVLRYLERIEHLILDEVHHIIDSRMMKRVIGKCKNTIARHGFSGSPYSLTTDDVELESLSGPPLSKVTMSQLIREGWISRPEITMWKYLSPKKDLTWSRRYSYQQAYTKGIVGGEKRNNLIVKLTLEDFNRDKVILILVRIIKHGKILSDLLLERGLLKIEDFDFIHGSTPIGYRRKIKEKVKARKLKILIASQIWNEGIDVPAIDTLIKADGGGGKEVEGDKGVRSVVQQIGRVARKPIDPSIGDVNVNVENVVKVHDFDDSFHKDLKRHSNNRYMTFLLEKEFIVRTKRL